LESFISSDAIRKIGLPAARIWLRKNRGEEMQESQNVNVRAFIDERSLSRYQIQVLALVVFIIAFDGIDVGIMGLAAPEIIRAWGISRVEMGSVLSSVFFGMAVGAALAGPLGDRFGRKPVIVVSVIWFGLTTAVSAIATGVPGLLVLRALTGVGLGAAIPTALTLMAECAPQRKRSLLLTIAFSGFTAGATISGFLAAWLIPTFGWQVALATAGLLPAALGAALFVYLPESVAFLALKGRAGAIPAILRKIDRTAVFAKGTAFWLPVAVDQSAGSVGVLLSKRYAIVVAMLCVAYFMGVLVTYIIVGWLPVITKDAGFSLAQGAVITSIFTLAGPVGSVCLGAAMDRMSAHRLLLVTFTISAIFLACVGIAPRGFGELILFMLALGFFFHGSMTGLQALSPQSFPTAARATGVGWMHAIGRVGAIGSGLLGALMLSWNLSLGQIFLALAVPVLIAGLAVAVMGAWGTKVDAESGTEKMLVDKRAEQGAAEVLV
jgi:MFS transporter, AAHS family, 4-hydroxybenzoate transporter